VVTEEQLWRVAQYVRSLSPEEPPRLREVVRAARVEGALPAAPGDSAWARAEEFYFPLVGQIVVRPRWFAPTVTGVWVQALHNGEEVALRLRWHDPSRSPDERWQPWQQLMLQTMQPQDGGPTAAQTLADAFTVQFPQAIPEGMDRPYFLMGDATEPVYLWQWESVGGQTVEATGRGMGRIEAATGPGRVSSQGTWEDGAWTVVMTRALASGEGGGLAFEPGRPIPMAFFAWDGDNSESGTRGAISTWYFLYLDEPGSSAVFVAPIAATLLTFVLGFVFVMRAQRRQNGGA
jgi:hypothetical protein